MRPTPAGAGLTIADPNPAMWLGHFSHDRTMTSPCRASRVIQFSHLMPSKATAAQGWAAKRRVAAAMFLCGEAHEADGHIAPARKLNDPGRASDSP